jgi:outer membrane protein assembly factor BamB
MIPGRSGNKSRTIRVSSGMNPTQTIDLPQKSFRLWPGVALGVLILLVRFVGPLVLPELLLQEILGGVVGGFLVLLWWVFFSRAPRLERWGGAALIIVAMYATSRIVDKSVAKAMMGFMFPMYSIPIVGMGFVLWAVLCYRLPEGPRRASMVAAIVLVCGGFLLIRTNGITGDGKSDLAWRWTKTAEEKLITQPVSLPVVTAVATPVAAPVAAKVPVEPVSIASAPISTRVAAAEWPGFRGPARDGVVSGVQIKTDWTASPPVEMWRRPIGPAWSSFAVQGNLLYTQEQRGEDELVSCYNAATGKPVWIHKDPARFWESNAGAGPRGTPTLSNGHVYTFGGTGIVNALDAQTGATLWTRNAATDTKKKTPGWGFSSSPLVVGDVVIVAASGKMAAYDLSTGEPRWVGPDGGDSYSSPQLANINGVEQVVLMAEKGATSVTPADGKVLWEYAWNSGTRIMQPVLSPDGDLLITSGDAMNGIGMRRIGVTHGPSGWASEEKWTSLGLKPGFNDSVIQDGEVFGFDGGILACIDLKDGKRRWKGGRYGHGQFVLLRDQGVLLVLSEEGEIALVKAAPDQFTELAKLPAIEGKTWNHPVVAGERLFVRNSTEMAGYRLALAAK